MADDFTLNVNPIFTYPTLRTPAFKVFNWGTPYFRTVQNNKIRLLVNSKGTPQEIVQQLNKQFQLQTLIIRVDNTFLHDVNANFGIVADLQFLLQAKVDNGKVTISVKDVIPLNLENVYTTQAARNGRITVSVDENWSPKLFSIENAKRDFTSVLGFGSTGKQFKETKAVGGQSDPLGAAAAVLALNQVAMPWSYRVINTSDRAGIALGLVNNDSLMDYATLDKSEVRIYYGTADLQSNLKTQVFSIGLNGSVGEDTMIQAGDFNGDGKVDLAVSFEHLRPENNQAFRAVMERRVGIYYSLGDKIASNLAAGRNRLNMNQADVTLMADNISSFDGGFGTLSNSSGIDVNRDGFDDLVIGSPYAKKLYVAAGTVTSSFSPTNIIDLSTTGIAGRGSFLTDTGAGQFLFDNSGVPYTLAPTGDRWYRFTTLGDGLNNDAVRLLVSNLPLGAIPKLAVELFDSAGRPMRAGQSAVSLRGLSAGTYYLHIINQDTQTRAYVLEISPPKDTQVIEALNVRDADKLNAGENNSRSVPAKPGPKMDVDPVVPLFTNALLRDAVYKAVNKKPGSTLRSSDLASIAYLSVPGATGSQLTDLNGFERLPNLIVLDLPGHNLSNGALVPLRSLTRLQSLNLRGSNVQVTDLVNLPTSLQQLILGGIKDGSAPASANLATIGLRRFNQLVNLQIGSATTNLIIPETASQDGPATLINTANNTFQIVGNLAPNVTLPALVNFNEGQNVTFASLMATPGLTITDRDPIVATTVAITDPTGQRTALQSQTASPALQFDKTSSTKLNIAITERMRSSAFTVEAWVLVTKDADLSGITTLPLSIINADWSNRGGFTIDISKVGGQFVWSARVKDKLLAPTKQEAAVVRDTWVHLALIVQTQGQNSLASLLVNGTSIGFVNLTAYAPPAIGSNLAIGLGGLAFDEIRLFNRARTAAEVVATRDNTIPANTPNLVGYWNFDDALTTNTKQVNTPRHATALELTLSDGRKTAPANQFTRLDIPAPFSWEGDDYISVRYDLGSNNSATPILGVRTAAGDYVIEQSKPSSRTVEPDFRFAWFTYLLKDMVFMSNRSKRLSPGETITSLFFETRTGLHFYHNFTYEKIIFTSRVVQAGQTTAQQLLQTTQTFRDLTSFGQNATTVEINAQVTLPTVNINRYRTTAVANNAFTFVDDGTYLLQVTAVDIDGASTSKSMNMAIRNTAPTTDIGGKPVGQVLAGTEISLSAIGNGPIVRGQASLDASSIDATNLRHEWKVSSPTGQIVSTTVAPSFKFTPTTAGNFTVTKTSTDPQGATDVDTVTITVNPKVVFTPAALNLQAIEGSPVIIGLAIGSSPASDRATRSYAWTVKQGSNTLITGTSSDIRFVPADNISYTIEATITDSFSVPNGPAQSLSGSSSMTFTPRDVAPSITLLGLTGNSFTTSVGQFTLAGLASATSLVQSQLDNANLSFVVSDPGTLDRPRVSINWGDGKSDHDLDPLANARHKFELPGTYDVQLTAIEPKSNAKSTASFQLVVNAVAPKLSIPAIGPVSDGQSVTLTPAIEYQVTATPMKKSRGWSSIQRARYKHWSVVNPN